MSVLLGLSFDQPSSPEVSFDAVNTDPLVGWGVAWYPAGELAAAVIRDPFAGHSAGLSEVLHDWERFRTSLVVSHLRGAAKRVTHRDTHPFLRIFGDRSWTIAHNGDLRGDLSLGLPLRGDGVFRPMGSTDTEHMFCWLLSEVAAAGFTNLADLGFDRLAALLATANELGTMSLLIADGNHLVAYRDVHAADTLWWTRSTPPHPTTQFAAHGISLEWSDSEDASHTMAAVTSVPLAPQSSSELAPGTLLVLATGSVVYEHTVSGHRTKGPERQRPPRAGAPLAVDGRPLDRPARRMLSVEHRTTYRYDEPVERSSHRLRLTPLDLPGQRVHAHSLDVGLDGVRFTFEDVFGNMVTGMEVHTPFTEMTVRSQSTVEEFTLIDRVDLLPERHRLPLVWMPWQRQMMQPYLLPMELPERQLRTLGAFAASFVERNRHDLFATFDDVNETIYRDFTYKRGFTTVETTPYEVYRSRAGVCQDFANLFICIARLLDVPARYRVGYLYTAADYENTLQSEASHAWAEVYLPHLGWRGYDPTNGCRVGADHVRVACGRNYRDATPTSGVIHRGGGEHLEIAVRVVDVSGHTDTATVPA